MTAPHDLEVLPRGIATPADRPPDALRVEGVVRRVEVRGEEVDGQIPLGAVRDQLVDPDRLPGQHLGIRRLGGRRLDRLVVVLAVVARVRHEHRGGRTADPQGRVDRLQCPRRRFVELEVLGAGARPEVRHQVGLVPDLERPRAHLVDAVALDPVLDGRRDEVDPGPHVVRGAAVSLPPEERLGLRGELARHEAEFDEGPCPHVEDGVEDLVDVSEGEDRLRQRRRRPEAAAVGCAVHEHVVVEEPVEPHIAGTQSVHRFAEVALPVRTQRLVRPPRAEAHAPDVMQRHVGRRPAVDHECGRCHDGQG